MSEKWSYESAQKTPAMAGRWTYEGGPGSPVMAGITINGRKGTSIGVSTDDGFIPVGVGLRSGLGAVPAAYAAINILSSQLAILERRVVGPDGVPRPNHPINALLDFPSRMVDPIQFWLILFRAYASQGNAYAFIRRDFVSKRPIELVPGYCERAEWVDSRHAPYQRYTLRLLGADGLSGMLFNRRVVANSNDVITLHGPGYNGMQSPSPIAFAAAAILESMERVVERHRSLLEEGGTLDKALTVDPEARIGIDQFLKVREAIATSYQAAKDKNQTPVLPPGVELKRIQALSASDMQLIELLKWGVEDVARVWDMSPIRLGHYYEGMRVSTFEHQAADFSRYTISPKATVCDSQLTRKLMPVDDVVQGLRIGSDVDNLARGSLSERISAADTAVTKAGIWLIDEGRELTGKRPLPNGEGKRLYQPKGAPTQEPPPRNVPPNDD